MSQLRYDGCQYNFNKRIRPGQGYSETIQWNFANELGEDCDEPAYLNPEIAYAPLDVSSLSFLYVVQLYVACGVTPTVVFQFSGTLGDATQGQIYFSVPLSMVAQLQPGMCYQRQIFVTDITGRSQLFVAGDLTVDWC